MNSKISQVYSEALFKLGEEKNSLDSIKDDLVYVKNTLDDNEELKSILRNPNINKADKKAMLDQIFNTIEKDALNFVKILIDKSRFFYFDDVVNDFIGKFNDAKDIAVGDLISARELSMEDVDSIKESLSKKFGKTVELNQVIDPDLIGGFQVKLDGKMIDNSLKGRLSNLKSSLKEKR